MVAILSLGEFRTRLTNLPSPNAKFKFNEDFYADLSWWISFLSVLNGKTLFPEEVPATDVQMDACGFGAGAIFS